MINLLAYRWIPPWGEPKGCAVVYCNVREVDNCLWIDPNYSHSFFLNEIYRNRFK